MLYLGKQHYNFINKETNQPVRGTSLYVAFTEANVDGFKCMKLNVRDGVAIPESLKPNDKINVTFTYNGKVESISKA